MLLKNINNKNQHSDKLFEHLNTAILVVFFVLIPFIFSYELIETVSLPRHIFITFTTCALLLVFIYHFLIKNSLTLKFSSFHIYFFVFYIFVLFSLLWSHDIQNSIIEITQLTSYFILGFIASQLQTKSIKRIFLAIYIGASIAALIGIFQAFNLNPPFLKMSTAISSTFGNKNHAAVYFDIVIPLALISFLTTNSYSKYISITVYTLSVSFILLSKTKGSLLAFTILTLIFLFIIYRNKTIRNELLTKQKVLQYIVFTFILPFGLFFMSNVFNINNVTEDKSTKNIPINWNTGLTSNSINTRLSWYKNAFELINKEPLIGVGYGAFRKAFVPYASFPNPVSSLNENNGVAQLHNDPYQLIIELGILGGGLIILIFTFILLKSFYILSKKSGANDIKANYILLGCFLAVISSLTHSFVDFPLRLPTSAILFWFITGVIIVQFSNTKTIHLTKKQSTATGILILFFCLIFYTHSFKLYKNYYIASEFTYKATVSILKMNNCTQSKNEIDHAVSLFFNDELIRRRYIQIYSRCDFSNALKLQAVEKVLDYEPAHPLARLTRAILYLESKKLELARQDFYYLSLILPHRPQAFIGLGDIATLSRNYPLARKYYEKAYKLEPQNTYPAEMLKQFDDKNI